MSLSWLNRIFGGPQDMPALTVGKKAPEINLSSVDGTKFSLQDALKHGPVIAAFFKISCPVCQYTFPFLERLHKGYGNQKVTVVGISQDDLRNSTAFMKEYGVTFPTLLDDPKGYLVSNAYGLTNVPTVFLIGQDGEIEMSSVGWVKKDFDDLNRRLADLEKSAPAQLFKPGEEIRDYRAG
jgi:peroxiredoxin